jgi:hypothetical protein
MCDHIVILLNKIIYEIKNIVSLFLAIGIIHPSTNPYSSLVVMVLKKQVTWHMCPNFLSLNSLIVKDKFLIPVINYLLYDTWR